jgi:sugar phosphate isomerase/epimerase
MDAAQTVGHRYLLVAYLRDVERRTLDDYRRHADLFNEAGAALRREGLQFAYHNHDFEFAPLDGSTVWETMLPELSPAIELELDVYWAAVGGRDPVAEIRANARRIRLLHMKDRAIGDEPHDAPVGDGVLPFPDLIEVARSAGVEWFVVEQDEPADALADIGRSLGYLTTLAQ